MNKLNPELLLEQLDILETIVWQNEQEFLEAVFPDLPYEEMTGFYTSSNICSVSLLMEDGAIWREQADTKDVLEWALSYPIH